MLPAQVQLETVVRGDTWTGIPTIGPVTIGGVRPTTHLGKVVMTFARRPGIPPAYVLSSAPVTGQGTIVIDDAAQWIFHMPPQPLVLADGVWQFEIQLQDVTASPNTLVLTPIMGTVEVLNNYPQT